MTDEQKERLFPIRFETNTCAKCGKEYQQPAIVTSFGVLVARCCPECVSKYEAAENSKNKNTKNNTKQ